MLYIMITFVEIKQIEIMKTKTLKNKVETMLIKNGNNIDDVKEMLNLHFEQASKNFTSVRTISEYIRTIY